MFRESFRFLVIAIMPSKQTRSASIDIDLEIQLDSFLHPIFESNLDV